ncbi:MAG: hypothetical protein O3A10_13835 [Chloroflexi bacterium]|nr:hypothetical protein [Chloroflexota bacterium]MDA1147571.1 hypothetical protein [Chloroflexota bacterium]MQC83059.1 hypothetical protein [Chloroflexota bacterium]PKB56689.1 MAG: hypothetical protein BZY69_00350 [SAR202 cluster bacterium Casp-Chloro-G1]
MRILSLSHRLADPLIDNHHIFNAPAVTDYEAIVVDVGGIAESIQNAVAASEPYLSFADLTVVNGEPIDGVTGIADTLRRRLDEFTRALERGAVVIVLAHPPSAISGVAGYQGLDRYFFLPAPAGMAWDSTLLRGSAGSTAAITAAEHPAVEVIESYRRDLLYRCFFNDRAPGFAGTARVIARSEGGLPIGVEFPVLNGRVIFLPSPRQNGARWLVQKESKALIAAFRELLGHADEDAPRWTAQVEIPEMQARTRERDLRQAAVERATSELAEAEGDLAERASLRDTLWRTGDIGLQPAVIRCAELLGFEAKASDTDAPLLTDGDHEVHYVVAGAEEAVGMEPHYRLRARLDGLIERRQQVARGLVVANGQRLTRPEERQREIAPALKVAAESVGYAVVTTRSMFAAAIACLEGLSEEKKAAIRTRLLNVNGVVTIDDLLPAAQATSETEPPEEPAAVPADAVAAEG